MEQVRSDEVWGHTPEQHIAVSLGTAYNKYSFTISEKVSFRTDSLQEISLLFNDMQIFYGVFQSYDIIWFILTSFAKSTNAMEDFNFAKSCG